MATWQADRLERFRRLVDLDSLPNPLAPGRGVVADWQEKMRSVSLQLEWEILFTNTWLDFGGGVREWRLSRETEHLAVKIFVSSNGFGLARRYFRRQAMSSPAPEYPYEPTVDGEVVTFFVSSPGPHPNTRNDSLMRLYRNVVFQIGAYNARIQVVEIADSLLDFARQNGDVLIEPRRPPISSPNETPAGEIQVRVPAAHDPFKDFRDTSFEVQVEAREGIDFMGFRENRANFLRKTQSSGGWIRAQAVDRQTLLSRVERFKIQ